MRSHLSAKRFKNCGSALVLTVVLTVLLSVIGVSFLMISRVDEAVTSNISDEKVLDSAAQSIVSVLSDELVKDVPGVAGQEYYDYPGDNDRWLGCIEPTVLGDQPAGETNCYWLQISDVTGYLRENKISTKYVNIKPTNSNVIKEYPEIKLNENGKLDREDEITTDEPEGESGLHEGQLADADGDGIADSKWIELDLENTDGSDVAVTTLGNANGTPVYAAIRVIDNCGMVNVNTALAFHSENEISDLVDGSMLSQVDLAGLIGRASADKSKSVRDILKDDSDAEYKANYLLAGKENTSANYDVKGRFTDSELDIIDQATDGDWWPTDYVDSANYKNSTGAKIREIEDYYTWRYPESLNNLEKTDMHYRFGVEDEIALRERFCIDTPGMTRLKALWPYRGPDNDPNFPMIEPYNSDSDQGLSDFVAKMVDPERISDPYNGFTFADAHKKQWLTTYSYDRIINPDGQKQFCVNIDPTRGAGLLDDNKFQFELKEKSRESAEKLYYAFVKAACVDKGYGSRNKLKIEELRKLGQLAVNIVDMRDMDNTPTCLDITVEGKPFDDEYSYLNPDNWTDFSDETIISSFEDPSSNYERYCYGLETSPVISGVAVAYEKYHDSQVDETSVDDFGNLVLPADPNDETFDWTKWEPKAHYAVELYNPYDVDIVLHGRPDDYRLVVWSKTRGNEIFTLNLNRGVGIYDIPARGFIIICDDANFWKQKIAERMDGERIKVVVVQAGNSENPFTLSSGLKEIDRDEGSDIPRDIDNRIRVSERIFLQRRVRAIEGGVDGYIVLDRFDPDHELVYWDPGYWDPYEGRNEDQFKIKQRFTMPDDSKSLYGRFAVDNIQWWDCLYPETVRFFSDDQVKLGVERDPNSITRNFDVDFSVPMKHYRETRYFDPPFDEYDGTKESWEKAGQSGDDYWPMLDFATVGDISRMWTVGPKHWEDVKKTLEKVDLHYQKYLNDHFHENYDYTTFDPNEVNESYFNDPNDPNMFLDTCSVGDYMQLVNKWDREDLFRLNLRDPRYSNLFQYVTMFDPSCDYIDNDGDGIEDEDEYEANGWYSCHGMEMKVPGRINVNTAPWYVIAQLPWVKADKDKYDEMLPFDDETQYDLARAIAAYRDKLKVEYKDNDDNKVVGPDYYRRTTDIPDKNPDESDSRWQVMKESEDIHDDLKDEDIREERGFASIGELALVFNDGLENFSIDKLGTNEEDIEDYPDLIRNVESNSGDSRGDGAQDDFDEKDLIFSRMSNLATVRSDTFTAYILVRLGANGPQKRYIAILDRSDVYPKYYKNNDTANDNDRNVLGSVKIVAFQEVSEIR